MTAKEEAAAIVEQFKKVNINLYYYDGPVGGGRMTTESAKSCAVIHVKGIIKHLPHYKIDFSGNCTEKWLHYESVLEEIEKL